MTLQAQVDQLQRRIKALETALGRVQLRPVPPPLPTLLVQIIGGQTISGIPMIQYAPDPFTASQAWNPTTQVSGYDIGLGYGYLYGPYGTEVGKVLIRHNYAGFTDPVIAGVCYVVGQPIAYPVTGGGFISAYPLIRG